MTQTNKNIFYITMIFAMAGWGASWVNAKVLSSYINEYEMIFFRNTFTLITLAPVLVFARKYFYINKKSLLLCIITSIVMIAYMKCYFLGTKYGTASLGGALVTTLIPINTFLFMAIFYKKRVLKKDIFALILGGIGVLTMLHVWTFNAAQIFTTENMYFLMASILWPILTIISSKSTKTSPMVFTFYMYLIMTILVSIFFVDFKNINYEGFDYIFWINLFIVSVISTTFATTVYFLGIEKLGANEVSTFIFLVPFFAILFSAIFLKEHISLSIIIGTIMTLFAVKILNNIKIRRK
ncbi:drug/metabolite transporter (DMT)-like permease [Malaciobacter marinus]|jgi:drug/metabolite transporter (DMT)-like permease|uniref:Drug/metabolite transporter (DMT)-like permease n=1 Tax=Malaciobacter marinus TaxID=505249 RepID=A0AB36ZV96_9BACT|nr:DMT family transporter [Malaciobacter marinus]PPK60530.1 drug/metabolite transporter (DMT)-like permease [Malaciobacter marinus]SKB65468.1 Permease of the drug/metabolite transporter (DMT) superfamily [Malaciobacter marinus]